VDVQGKRNSIGLLFVYPSFTLQSELISNIKIININSNNKGEIICVDKSKFTKINIIGNLKP
jgi:hypothetical protein